MPYQCLRTLDEQSIHYVHAPFAQGSIAERLDIHWGGSCDVIAHEWLLRKVSATNIEDVTTYQTTEAYLPHLLVTGKTNPEEADIIQVKTLMSAFYTSDTMSSPKNVETREEVIEYFLKFIGSQKFNSGIFSSKLILYPSKTEESSSQAHTSESLVKGHAIAFVKKDDAVSFYDPNHGEITFTKFSDFCIWLRQEGTIGSLKYLFPDPQQKEPEDIGKLYSLPAPILHQDVDSKNRRKLLENRMMELRLKGIYGLADAKYMIGPFEVYSWYGDQYANPEKYKRYMDVKTDVFLMREVPSPNNLELRRLLTTPDKAAYIIVANELYLARKGQTIEIKKLNVSGTAQLNTLLQNLNPFDQRLGGNDKFKKLSGTTLKPSILAFIDENTGNEIKQSFPDEGFYDYDTFVPAMTNCKSCLFSLTSDESVLKSLFESIRSRNIDQINSLLPKVKTNINDKLPVLDYEGGLTSLQFAAIFGTKEIMEILIQAGADPDIKDSQGRTAFDIANENELFSRDSQKQHTS